MSKLTIVIDELQNNKNQAKNKEGEDERTNLYSFLLFSALNMRIKDNFLYINPNYQLINFNLEVIFKHNNQNYNLLIDGKNKTLIAQNLRLCNINKLDLNFLKVQKEA